MFVDDDAMTTAHAYFVSALAEANHEIDQLKVALIRRTVIGQAQGILMVRLDIDADTAFKYLKRVSSHTNRRLLDIAVEVAQTREMPATER